MVVTIDGSSRLHTPFSYLLDEDLFYDVVLTIQGNLVKYGFAKRTYSPCNDIDLRAQHSIRFKKHQQDLVPRNRITKWILTDIFSQHFKIVYLLFPSHSQVTVHEYAKKSSTRRKAVHISLRHANSDTTRSMIILLDIVLILTANSFNWLELKFNQVKVNSPTM